MVDPQLQGIKWIKKKYGDDLKVVRLGNRGYLDVIERSVSNGEVVLIENLNKQINNIYANNHLYLSEHINFIVSKSK